MLQRRTPRAPTTGRLKGSRKVTIDRDALRRVLAPEGVELVRYMETRAKATGRPSVNPGVMWKYFTTAIYASGDLPLLATREALQNSRDAIIAAIKARQIGKTQGTFAVTWDATDRSLTWDDNGIGMDEQTILDKFLTIGETGKGSAESSEGAAGGFGVAKAVILGTSTTFRWEMHTRNNRVVANGMESDVQVFEAPWRQGTQLTIYDVDPKFVSTYNWDLQREVPLDERLRSLLSFNDLPGITLSLNGQRVPPAFSRRGGSVVRVDASWGSGYYKDKAGNLVRTDNTAKAKAYKRPPGDRQGGYFIRLNGLFQFSKPNQRGNLKADVVIDLSTRIRPGDEGYPLTANRDALFGTARYALNEIIAQVEQENESIGRSKEDIVFDPEDDPRGEVAELADLTQLAADNPSFEKALGEAAGGILDYYAAQEEYKGVQAPTASTAPAVSRPDKDQPTRQLPAGIASTAGAIEIEEVEGAEGGEVAIKIRTTLASADASRATNRGDSSPQLGDGGILTPTVMDVLDRAETGQKIGEGDVQVIENALDTAIEATLGPGGGGLMQAATLNAAGRDLGKIAASYAKPAPRNPFGALAGLRISRKNYDSKRAYRFKKNYGRWLPQLTLWDATLRLITSTAGIRRKFKPGFHLDDSIGASVAQSSSDPRLFIVYIQPDRLKQAIKAHKTRPQAIAAYLHHLAVHELTHMDGRMDELHSESFVSAREDLGQATAHLLPAIASLAVSLLNLKVPKTPAEKKVARLQKQVRKLKAKGTSKAASVPKRTRVLAAFGGVMAEQLRTGVGAGVLSGFLERHRGELDSLLREGGA